MQASTNKALQSLGLTRTRRRKLIQTLVRTGVIDLDSVNAASLELYGKGLDVPDVRPAARKRRKEHFVYIFKANDVYKIGRSVDPEWRAKQIQTGSSVPIEIVHLIKTTEHGLERALHRRFNAKRQQGEWFALDNTDIDWIKAFGASLR